jgi:hypothetical protein
VLHQPWAWIGTLIAAAVVAGIILHLPRTIGPESALKSAVAHVAGHRVSIRADLSKSRLRPFRDACLAGRFFGALDTASSPRLVVVEDGKGRVSEMRHVECEVTVAVPPSSPDSFSTPHSEALTGTTAFTVEVWRAILPCEGSDNMPWRLRNAYYPQPGRLDEVSSWRVHASEVRKDLGRPSGCVWRRLSQASTRPEVVWELPIPAPSPDLAKQEEDAAQTKTFQAVIRHMRTLIHRFEGQLVRVYSVPVDTP